MRLDSRELAEWDAYERAFGLLGNEYIHETLAQILDAVHLGNHMAGFKWEENPVPEPERTIRPSEMYERSKLFSEQETDPQSDDYVVQDEEEFAKYFEE